MNRRSFINKMALTAASVPLVNIASGFDLKSFAPDSISIFSKPLDFLSYDELAEYVAKMGFTGIDLTVRPKGIVLPENVRQDLPKAVKAAEKKGLKINMMTTAITSSDEKYTEEVLNVASDQGVKIYRFGYFSYDLTKGVMESIDEAKKQLEKIARLNEKYRIHGAYQNHSGTRIGGPVWDVYHMVKDFDPRWIGVQYDIRHAVAEGGYAWPIALDLLVPWIKCLAIKDFKWSKSGDKWRIESVPIGEGMVDFKEFFTVLRKNNIVDVPYTVHYEYHLWPDSTTNDAIKLEKASPLIQQDLSKLKQYLNNYSG